MAYQLSIQNSKINFFHTNHSGQRASQRGIANETIEMLIADGEVIYKQGLRFYYMIQSQLNYFALDAQDKLRNLVVVMASDSDTVITCYKNKDGVKKINRKSKRLIRY